MKKREESHKKGSPAYMSTYGDMMTLLLTFFVMLFSMSTVDVNKFKAFIDSYSGATGILDSGEAIMSNQGMLGNGIKQFPSTPPTPIPTLEDQATTQMREELAIIQKELEAFIEEQALTGEVGVEQKGDAVVIRFSNTVLFESGKALLKTEAINVLSILSNELKQYVNDGYRLSFEGHTDNVPIKTAQFPSNWELSAARAIAVAKYFVEAHGFAPANLSAEGFGEYMPIADNTTVEGRATNRRVEVKLTRGN